MAGVATLTSQAIQVACAQNTDRPTASELSTQTYASTSNVPRLIAAARTLPLSKTRRTFFPTHRIASMINSDATQPWFATTRTCWTRACPSPRSTRCRRMVAWSATRPHRCRETTRICTIAQVGDQTARRVNSEAQRLPLSCQQGASCRKRPMYHSIIGCVNLATLLICDRTKLSSERQTEKCKQRNKERELERGRGETLSTSQKKTQDLYYSS